MAASGDAGRQRHRTHRRHGRGQPRPHPRTRPRRRRRHDERRPVVGTSDPGPHDAAVRRVHRTLVLPALWVSMSWWSRLDVAFVGDSVFASVIHGSAGSRTSGQHTADRPHATRPGRDPLRRVRCGGSCGGRPAAPRRIPARDRPFGAGARRGCRRGARGAPLTRLTRRRETHPRRQTERTSPRRDPASGERTDARSGPVHPSRRRSRCPPRRPCRTGDSRGRLPTGLPPAGPEAGTAPRHQEAARRCMGTSTRAARTT